MWRHDAVSEFKCDALMWQRNAVSEFIWASTWLCSDMLAVPVNTHNFTLAHHRVPSSSVVEHPTRSWRVVGSNPIWDSVYILRTKLKILKLQSGMDIRVKICTWHWLLLMLKRRQQNFKDVSTKQLRPLSVFLKSQLSDGFVTVHSSARAMPAKT